MVETLSQTVEIAMIVLVVDLVLGWVQLDHRRWPRQLTHWLTEPLLVPARWALSIFPTGGWDVSTPVVVLLLTTLKVGVLS